MNTLERTIQEIKSSGFSHVKVELEAKLNRQDEYADCDECDANGHIDCSTCEGSGAVVESEQVGQNYYDNYVECDECYGDGTETCGYCNGEGQMSTEYNDEEYCEQFLRDHVSQEARDALVYGNFYDDGSVDSEFTFTVAVENSHTVLEWIKAFSELAEANGQGMDVDGAGMHITVMRDGNYRNLSSLPSAKINNFIKQMQKLLPAMYFLATPNYRHRTLEYRRPQVEWDNKYSAIYTHNNTCIEYRLFETCYDKPEAFFEFLEVIANSLKYYNDQSLEAKTLDKTFGLSGGTSLSQLFENPEQLRILNAQITELKPRNKTIKQLKKERGITCTIQSLSEKTKGKTEQLRKEYQEIHKKNEQIKQTPLTQSQLREIDEEMMYNNMSRIEAENRVRRVRHLPDLREFIQNNINSNFEYTLAV